MILEGVLGHHLLTDQAAEEPGAALVEASAGQGTLGGLPGLVGEGEECVVLEVLRPQVGGGEANVAQLGLGLAMALCTVHCTVHSPLCAYCAVHNVHNVHYTLHYVLLCTVKCNCRALQ